MNAACDVVSSNQTESNTYDVIGPGNYKPAPLPTSLNPCYNISRFEPPKTENELTTESIATEKKPSHQRMLLGICFVVVVGVVLVCVSVSLALAVWSAVEVRKLSSSNALNPEWERVNDSIDSLHGQLNNTLQDIDVLTKMLPGQLPSIPATSCLQVSPSSPSGYYWVWASNGSAVRVYCDMTRSCGGVTGGWTRVAYLQFESGSDPCPDGFRERSDSGIRTCGIGSTTAACPSVLFDTYGIPYSRVCGKVLAYQDSSTDAFGNLIGRQRNVALLSADSVYVDGVSLTHGRTPRQHIWTFAAAHNEGDDRRASVCQCSYQGLSGVQLPLAFIGQDYFCDSGVQGRFDTQRDRVFHGDNPLWDGAGCGPNSTCCSFNKPPWFHKHLPQPTTDDIEMRVCRDQDQNDEDIPIAHVEIYVH